MLRRRSAAKGQDGKDGGDDKPGHKADGKEHLQFDCKKCGTANDVAVVRARAWFCPFTCAQSLLLHNPAVCERRVKKHSERL